MGRGLSLKTKHLAFLILIFIIVGCPFSVQAFYPAGLNGAEVICTVHEKYEFTVPEDAILTYPETSMHLGEFVIGDILLKSGETLSVTLTMGQMTADYNDDKVLNYNIAFSAPSEIDAAKIGLGYDISLSIDSHEFEDLRPGTYTAPLLFQVSSNTTKQVVWEQTINISAYKPTNQSENQNNPDDDYNISEIDEVKDGQDDNAKDVYQILPQASDSGIALSDGIELVEEPDMFEIADNEVPMGSPSIRGNLLKLILIVCSSVVILIVTYLLISSKTKRKNDN